MKQKQHMESCDRPGPCFGAFASQCDFYFCQQIHFLTCMKEGAGTNETFPNFDSNRLRTATFAPFAPQLHSQSDCLQRQRAEFYNTKAALKETSGFGSRGRVIMAVTGANRSVACSSARFADAQAVMSAGKVRCGKHGWRCQGAGQRRARVAALIHRYFR